MGHPSSKTLIWVMDVRGNFYFDQPQEGVVHHSSFFGGRERIACAGTITIKDGQILSIDNGSGHYKPPQEFLNQAVARLRELGVNPVQIKSQSSKSTLDIEE